MEFDAIHGEFAPPIRKRAMLDADHTEETLCEENGSRPWNKQNICIGKNGCYGHKYEQKGFQADYRLDGL